MDLHGCWPRRHRWPQNETRNEQAGLNRCFLKNHCVATFFFARSFGVRNEDLTNVNSLFSNKNISMFSLGMIFGLYKFRRL